MDHKSNSVRIFFVVGQFPITLTGKGADILGTEWRFIVFQDLDDDNLAFAYVADEDGYGSTNKADLQRAFEHSAASFLKGTRSMP